MTEPGAGLPMTFWKVLEAMTGPCGVRVEWQHHLGDVPFESVLRYLRPVKRVAELYPRWVEGREVEPYEVVEHEPDTFVLVHPRSRVATPIRRGELVAYELHRERLVADLAAAFGFRVGSVPASPSPFAWPVVVYEPLAGFAFPAFLVVTTERTRLTRVVTAFAEASLRPFLVLTPTVAKVSPAMMEVVERRKLGLVRCVMRWRCRRRDCSRRPPANGFSVGSATPTCPRPRPRVATASSRRRPERDGSTFTSDSSTGTACRSASAPLRRSTTTANSAWPTVSTLNRTCSGNFFVLLPRTAANSGEATLGPTD